jgi:2-iminobutanoate/2-iminopropanoate deaminase
MKSVPSLKNHPKAGGPYSQCVIANDLVFISGQTPIAPGGKPGEWAATDIRGQTRECLKSIESILKELGLPLVSVVKTTVFLANPNDLVAMNEAYGEFFPVDPPARSTAKLGVKLPGLRLSIDAIAIRGPEEEN